MFKYFPHTASDEKEMLNKINLKELDDLFSDVPNSVKVDHIDIPLSLSEIELRKKANLIANKNKKMICFAGAGSYDCYIPSVISTLTSRQEFLTSYTPYQAEISQGTLQYIFEYQTLICNLTGMDVANASNYDGATAAMESMLMAINQTRKNTFILPSDVAPSVREVVKTLARMHGVKIIECSVDEVKDNLVDDLAGVLLANPNFFGEVRDYTDLIGEIHANSKAVVAVYVDPSTLALIKSPGEMGADIACGEAQSLGIPMSFGGPYLGFMASTAKLMRKLPGRIVGMTKDAEGKRGYVLTLQAREQHIRREKANSNICSNQSLMALHALIYASVMGEEGLTEVAKRAYNNTHYLKEELVGRGLAKVKDYNFFKEFVAEVKFDVDEFLKYMEDNGILAGVKIDNNHLLICASEVRTKEEIDNYVKLVEAYNVR